MTSRRFRSALVTIISIGTLAGLVYYLYSNVNKYLALLRVSVPGLITLLVFSIANLYLGGLINVNLFRSLGVDLLRREGFYLAASSSLANQLPLPAGLITRAMYLKRKHDLSYLDYLSASLALFFCSIAVNGFIGCSILLYWFLFQKTTMPLPLLLGFGMMASSVIVFLLPFMHLRRLDKLSSWVDKALQGWTLISRNPGLLLRLLGLQNSFMLLFALRQMVAFYMLSQKLTFGQAILISSGSVLTQLVSFAPGGLGVREAIVGGIASALGFDFTVSIAAIEVDRIVSTFNIVIIGWISTILLGKNIADNSTKSTSDKG